MSTIALAVVSLVLYLAFVGFVWAEDTKHSVYTTPNDVQVKLWLDKLCDTPHEEWSDAKQECDYTAAHKKRLAEIARMCEQGGCDGGY